MKALVVASEPVTGEQLRAALPEEDSSQLEVMVIAPALHKSMLRFWISDADEAIARAARTARETVASLSAQGIAGIGDTAESTLTEAVHDTLVAFPADRVILFVHGAEDERYGEHADLRELEAQIGIPVEEHFVEAT
jgi:hypothetical protein